MVEQETTRYSSVLYFYPENQSRAQGVRHALVMDDWRGPTGTLSRRLRITAQGGTSFVANETFVDNVSETLLTPQRTLTAQSTKRGYTLHEHLDNSGLVHMNARLYDPLMARFLSPDPVLAYPENPQDLNRYSYVHNRPLVHKDPSGEAVFFAVPLIYAWASSGIICVRFCGPALSVVEGVFAPGPSLAAAEGFAANRLSAGVRMANADTALTRAAGQALSDVPSVPYHVAKKAPVHHICTDKNCISAASGGPWTPRFDAIFQKVGMNLDDALNKVAIPGHKGPHPEAYHQAIFDRLTSATDGLNGAAYKDALQVELRAIGTELRTPGSMLNNLVTKR
ncbi:MAG: AHH domain-containing protein [Moraxellaceae bacterium]|nr:AHH domain-containing protein [Moraxellaceae bacterium]